MRVSCNQHEHLHFGSDTQLRTDHTLAAGESGALEDANQTNASANARGIEAASVVGHRQHQPTPLAA